MKTALLAAFVDLHNGFIAVGGLTSVGRGLFEVNKLLLNGEDMTEKFKAVNNTKSYDLKTIYGGEQN